MPKASGHRVVTSCLPPSALKGSVTLALEDSLAQLWVWACRGCQCEGQDLLMVVTRGTRGADHLALRAPGS